ncbi:phage terminase small subunit P27 family [Martelella alba]|uniref:Phage terminase small subunit P27 family n=1 Tax=Martelella alba TaxID=2590451 RepID=A0A506U608_9HYPH|nr:phage terminase small subunit P27 family [Martelella alba]TPW28918.1 phage terminase small subunit P27 family [Martelella alba]
MGTTRGPKAEPRELDNALTDMPVMPASLPEAMAAEWQTVVSDLIEREILNEAMLGTVETFIRAKWNERQAQTAIDEFGAVVRGADGSLKQNPACSLLGKSQAVIVRLSAELGLTPASRARTGMKQEKDDENDQFGLFSF